MDMESDVDNRQSHIENVLADGICRSMIAGCSPVRREVDDRDIGLPCALSRGCRFVRSRLGTDCP